MRQIIFAIILLAVVTPASASRRTELRNPSYRLEKPVSIARLKEAVEGALLKKKWVITKTTEDTVEALLHVRKHKLAIRIELSSEIVKFNYVSSQGLLYKKKRGKVEFIHVKYYTWIRYLKDEIMLRLAAEET